MISFRSQTSSRVEKNLKEKILRAHLNVCKRCEVFGVNDSVCGCLAEEEGILFAEVERKVSSWSCKFSSFNRSQQQSCEFSCSFSTFYHQLLWLSDKISLILPNTRAFLTSPFCDMCFTVSPPDTRRAAKRLRRRNIDLKGERRFKCKNIETKTDVGPVTLAELLSRVQPLLHSPFLPRLARFPLVSCSRGFETAKKAPSYAHRRTCWCWWWFSCICSPDLPSCAVFHGCVRPKHKRDACRYLLSAR